jgi:hypothetical protein
VLETFFVFGRWYTHARRHVLYMVVRILLRKSSKTLNPRP